MLFLKAIFIYLLIYFLNVCLFLRKRDREREREKLGEGQREKEIQNQKQAPVSELSAQSPTWRSTHGL